MPLSPGSARWEKPSKNEDSLDKKTLLKLLHSLSFLILYSLLPYLLISLYSCGTTAFANTENSFAEAGICGIILICLWFMSMARATYQSIVDGYSPADDGIVAEAKARIEKLKK